MSFQQYMQPRQRCQFQAVGEFLFVEACDGSVQITTERGEYRLKQGAQIIDPRLSGRVTVENMGEAGNVMIVCGYGRYVPPSDGREVEVTAMPSVTLSPNQAIDIGKMPPMAFEADQGFAVTQMPEMVLAEGQKLAIGELPRMKLENGQAVRVYSTTALTTKPAIPEKCASQVLTIAGDVELAANSSRCHVLVKAGSANTAPVVIGGGWSLAAGEHIKLETTAALAFAGTDGDTIEIIEVTR